MYLEHFGLREFPFSLAPDPRYLYLSAQHREALAHLLYGVTSEGGFVQLTGEVGTGKTTVCRCFLEQLPPGTRAAVILNPCLGAEELLAAVCDEFGIERPPGAAGRKDSLDRINRFLLDVHAEGGRAVLVVDEAQNLGPAVLEQVRLLTNLETSRHKLLQVILMGQPELRVALARPELRQLAQRVTARFHLRPLGRGETGAYVRHRLQVAGCHDELFPESLVGRLRRMSGGVPRMINILCDRALLGAFVQGKHRVDAATLRQAAREVAGEVGVPGLAWRPPALAAAILAGALLVMAVAHRLDRPADVPDRTPEPAPAAAPIAAPAVAPAVAPVVAPRAAVPTVTPPSSPPGTAVAVPAPSSPKVPATIATTRSADPARMPTGTSSPGPAKEPAVPLRPAGEAPPPAQRDLPASDATAPKVVIAEEAMPPAAPAPAAPASIPVVAPPPLPSSDPPVAPPPTAPSPAPAPPAPPLVLPGVLRALMAEPEAQSEEEAWRGLYRLWGIRAREGENGCAQALRHGLDCLRGDDGLEQLRLLNRPAILRVYEPSGAPRWLVLERLEGRQVTLVAGGARTVVDAERIAGYGIREYAVLWRPPAGTGGALAAGDRGPGVAWLAQRLAVVSGVAAIPSGAALFDAALGEQVRAFQRARGLETDGIAGPAVLLALDTDPQPGTPTLAAAAGR